MRPPLPRLHAVTDEQIARRPDLDRIAAKLASVGADLGLHARGRSLSGLEHYHLAVHLAATAGMLFINDRLDVALATDAAGVQLRDDSLPVADARRVRPEWWIGCSVHSLEEARAAVAQRPDYLVLGPMYETTSHPIAMPLGLDALRRVAGLGVPVIAIGGVTADRAAELRGAGAYGVAAIRTLWDAHDPYDAARHLLAALHAA